MCSLRRSYRQKNWRALILVPQVVKWHNYSFLTTAPNGVVEPIHNKAMPVLLMTPADVERWLEGTHEEALDLQKPAPDDAIVMDPALEKKAA